MGITIAKPSDILTPHTIQLLWEEPPIGLVGTPPSFSSIETMVEDLRQLLSEEDRRTMKVLIATLTNSGNYPVFGSPLVPTSQYVIKCIALEMDPHSGIWDVKLVDDEISIIHESFEKRSALDAIFQLECEYMLKGYNKKTILFA